DLAREAIAAFAQIEAKVKFASYEPCFDEVPCNHILGLLDWLIIGSQTKPFRPPTIGKVREIVEACDKARVPVFLKDNLKLLIDENCPDDSDLQPNHDRQLRMKHAFLCKGCDGEACHKCGVVWNIRQEMPDAKR
ncbi:hypothetical protein LCGC14_2967530, partial [marine sediment metagenome]